VAKDAWTFTIYGENLTNSNASTLIGTDQFIVAQIPLRPQVIGASFSYSFRCKETSIPSPDV
jgi:iron complex outermembrane receptor protein